MPDRKIPELASGGNARKTDLLPVSRTINGQAFTVKTTLNNFLEATSQFSEIAALGSIAQDNAKNNLNIKSARAYAVFNNTTLEIINSFNVSGAAVTKIGTNNQYRIIFQKKCENPVVLVSSDYLGIQGGIQNTTNPFTAFFDWNATLNGDGNWVEVFQGSSTQSTAGTNNGFTKSGINNPGGWGFLIVPGIISVVIL